MNQIFGHHLCVLVIITIYLELFWMEIVSGNEINFSLMSGNGSTRILCTVESELNSSDPVLIANSNGANETVIFPSMQPVPLEGWFENITSSVTNRSVELMFGYAKLTDSKVRKIIELRTPCSGLLEDTDCSCADSKQIENKTNLLQPLSMFLLGIRYLLIYVFYVMLCSSRI